MFHFAINTRFSYGENSLFLGGGRNELCSRGLPILARQRIALNESRTGIKSIAMQGLALAINAVKRDLLSALRRCYRPLLLLLVIAIVQDSLAQRSTPKKSARFSEPTL